MYDWIKTTIRTVDRDVFHTFDCRINEKITVNPLQASHIAIRKITKNYPPPYTLYVSGGIDSQAMLYAWHTSKIPFNTFSAKYKWGFNDHDLENLEIFSAEHKIPIKYHNVDIIKFYETEHDYYANTYKCGSNQITAHMKLASLTTTGTVIFSGELINHGRGNDGYPDSNNMGLYHYRNITKPNFIPFFFLYGKELANSFVCHHDRVIDGSGNYPMKVQIYNQNGFPVIPQKQKYNGFEKIKDYFDEFNTIEIPTIQKLDKGRFRSRRVFDILYRNKYETKFSNYRYQWIR